MNNDPRHRVEHRQLWIDKVRDGLEKTGSREDIELSFRILSLAELTGATVESVMMLPRDRLTDALNSHGLMGHLPTEAINALMASGYPHEEIAPSNLKTCKEKVGGALNWCALDILWNPETHIMLLDDGTAKAIADSSNSEITAAELQHLPHNPCLIEFYRPIEVAEKVKRGVRLRAVGFETIGQSEAPAAVVCFYLDYWQTTNRGGARSPATIGIWFGGLNVLTVDRAARSQIGFESASEIEEGITNACLRVARNLWDFVTSRSIRYEQVQRKPLRHTGTSPGRISEAQSNSDRQVSILFISRDSKSPVSESKTDRPTPRPWDHQIEIPGTFHEFVYCAKCGDLHRHDLLGQACRKCGEMVGPRINLRVEKYWHSPYVKGPEGTPLKNVVRDVRYKKPPV